MYEASILNIPIKSLHEFQSKIWLELHYLSFIVGGLRIFKLFEIFEIQLGF
jgi:hypothetical protein